MFRLAAFAQWACRSRSTGFPGTVNTLADAIRAADGVIFCTPESNFSLPPGLSDPWRT
jgi:NAD(P)H-dependent FMN reductase